MNILLTLVIVVAVGQTAATPQTPSQPPARDRTAATQKGTARIQGHVTSADGGRGLRRARITIRAPELGTPSSRSVSTGLDGSYAFTDLPAGRYRISVARGGYLGLEYGQRRPGEQGRPLDLADGALAENIDFVLPRMGVIAGRVSDETGEPIEGVSVYAMRSVYFEGVRRFVPVALAVVTDDAGEYKISRLSPGSYAVVAKTRDTWTVTENGKTTTFAYLPTYFPGVPSTSDATRINVGIGQTVAGIDLSLIPGRAPTISGTAVDSQGRPFQHVSLSVNVRGQTFASFNAGPDVTVAADGSFVAKEVPPGDYTLTAVRYADDPLGPEVALLPLAVDTTDIDGLTLIGSSGGTVTGRIAIEGQPAPKPSGVRLTFSEPLRTQPDPSVLGAFRQADSVTPSDDWTFKATHVLPRARVQVSLPNGWMLKRVTAGGKDIQDAVLDLSSGQTLSDVEVIITKIVTKLEGQLTDDKGAPSPDGTVIVFARDSTKWFENARTIKAARPDQQGHWRIEGLPAGDYLAIALDYAEDGSWYDPEFLDSLRKDARDITLADGDSQQVTLKLVVPK